MTLESPASDAFRFAAGQYVRVVTPDGRAIPFSVASAPERLPEIEIHFRPLPGSDDAKAMLALVENARTFEIEGPFGDVFVAGPTATPLRLIAGGTGIAQCLAIVDHLERVGQREPVHLVWSVSAPAHAYAQDILESVARRERWFRFEIAIDVPGEANGAVATLRRDGVPAEPEVILAGSPPFVYAVCDSIDAQGGAPGRLRSDVFDYAPR
jgi:NAD(P)H-flavin reductase